MGGQREASPSREHPAALPQLHDHPPTSPHQPCIPCPIASQQPLLPTLPGTPHLVSTSLCTTQLCPTISRHHPPSFCPTAGSQASTSPLLNTTLLLFSSQVPLSAQPLLHWNPNTAPPQSPPCPKSPLPHLTFSLAPIQ